MNNSHQYNPSWNPNWFLSVILDNHIDAMVARYSCLLTLRLDFFYKKDTPTTYIKIIMHLSVTCDY